MQRQIELLTNAVDELRNVSALTLSAAGAGTEQNVASGTEGAMTHDTLLMPHQTNGSYTKETAQANSIHGCG
jgi:hypothetical protein